MVVRSFVVYLLAGILAVLAGNVWVFVIGRSLMSLSLGNSGLMLTTLAERTPANRHGLAFAIMNSAGPVGAFVGPLLGGPIVDHWGFRTLMWINVVVMVMVILALSFGYVDSYRGKSQAPILQHGCGFDPGLLPGRTTAHAFLCVIPAVRRLDAGLFLFTGCRDQPV